MRLEKAIEVLNDIKDSGIDAGHYDAEEAIELGIEALKEIEQIRLEGKPHYLDLLPGETPPENPLPRLADAISNNGKGKKSK